MSRFEAGTKLAPPKATKRIEGERFCACGVRLSAYNDGDACSIHFRPQHDTGRKSRAKARPHRE